MKGKNSSTIFEQHFLLLVSMVILIVISKAVKGDAKQHGHKTQTEDSREETTFVNETAGNLTIDFNSGDLAAEQEESKHQLIITKADSSHRSSSKRYVECWGENITSLSAISCDSMESCEEKKSTLFEQKKCRRFSSLNCWRECSNDGEKRNINHHQQHRGSFSFSHRRHESSPGPSCLQIQLPVDSGRAGIVQCTSEENGVNVTTFDHYTVAYSNATLLSSFKNKQRNDLIKIKVFVASLVEDLISNSNSSQSDHNSSVTLFVDEEVTSLECQVPKLLFHKDGLIIRAHRKDGSTVNLDSKMTSMDFDGFLKVQLTTFRVPNDIVAFSCSAQKTISSGEWLEKWINVAVQDLPSEVIVKSLEGKNLDVDLTSGAKVNLRCQLTGPFQVKKSIRNQMRQTRYNLLSEPSSKSLVGFLRFLQVAGENLICEDLDSDKFHFIFNLAPSAPKIYKPLNQQNSSSSVHLIYQEEHFVDQTLFCLFNGEPKPVITWIKNGHKFLSTKSMGIRTQGNETLEHVKLPLDSKKILPSDFENGNGKSAHLNLSCVASNYFGSDRLDFIIMMTEGFEHCSGNSNTTTKSGKGTT